MRTLVIDTSTDYLSLALADGDQLIDHVHDRIGRGHAEQIIPKIACFDDGGRADRILVSCGPGSFTGIRIGIAAARALGFAWGATVHGYETLTLQARAAGDVVTIVNLGGHGEWFVQRFGEGGMPKSPVQSLPPTQAMTLIAKDRVYGTASDAVNDLEPAMAAMPLWPDARDWHRLSPAHLFAPPHPIYGRAPDAKLPGGVVLPA